MELWAKSQGDTPAPDVELTGQGALGSTYVDGSPFLSQRLQALKTWLHIYFEVMINCLWTAWNRQVISLKFNDFLQISMTSMPFKVHWFFFNLT